MQKKLRKTFTLYTLEIDAVVVVAIAVVVVAVVVVVAIADVIDVVVTGPFFSTSISFYSLKQDSFKTRPVVRNSELVKMKLKKLPSFVLG